MKKCYTEDKVVANISEVKSGLLVLIDEVDDYMNNNSNARIIVLKELPLLIEKLDVAEEEYIKGNNQKVSEMIDKFIEGLKILGRLSPTISEIIEKWGW